MDSKSALQDNIEAKGQYAYYYAHAKRPDTEGEANHIGGHGIVTGGAPIKLNPSGSSLKASSSDLKAISITKYTWIDADEKVKIYIKYSEIGIEDGVLTKEDTDIDFQVRALRFKFVLNDNIYCLNIKTLHETIVPENCKVDIRNNKIVIVLHKEDDSTWRELSKK
mmetsp:Transcript_36216/g.41239  ORF Transcript_36216/g.41239 Transcript_36216/m.41239 type:complete len:166 (+) Transcript_36216:173-670(+)|eukprot:CAMPEP_0115019410 /NCGR_PEP_ID=MMETSP0216-20121206/29430_1 /TAXON_ID=223996 /ORGANISM="Protocruzia adherens, Strain Boccale" /LENGTH=165 /DNA_ID=CAMNT_0002390881 /DNA_START=328 /DNA_END=825 /DNA_ORIENTATION=-